MIGYPVGTVCVIVGPLNTACLGDVVTVLADAIPSWVPKHGGAMIQEITPPLSTEWPNLPHFWHVCDLRPIDYDTDETDQDVIEQYGYDAHTNEAA